MRKLRDVAPDLAVTVHFEEDYGFQWDGDGPDPVEEGFTCYDVEVRASIIFQGEIVSRSEYMGGHYAKGGDLDTDLSGYFPQMAHDAVCEMIELVGFNRSRELQLAEQVLSGEMTARYQEQQTTSVN